MERRVSVNAEATSELVMTPDGLPQGWPQEGWPAAEASAEQDPPEVPEADAAESDPPGQGPCLYLGPVGQRCTRPALAGGFCAAHRPGGPGNAARNPVRMFAAAGAIIALLWPYLEDLVSEVIRWAHSR